MENPYLPPGRDPRPPPRTRGGLIHWVIWYLLFIFLLPAVPMHLLPRLVEHPDAARYIRDDWFLFIAGVIVLPAAGLWAWLIATGNPAVRAAKTLLACSLIALPVVTSARYVDIQITLVASSLIVSLLYLLGKYHPQPAASQSETPPAAASGDSPPGQGQQ